MQNVVICIMKYKFVEEEEVYVELKIFITLRSVILFSLQLFLSNATVICLDKLFIKFWGDLDSADVFILSIFVIQ